MSGRRAFLETLVTGGAVLATGCGCDPALLTDPDGGVRPTDAASADAARGDAAADAHVVDAGAQDASSLDATVDAAAADDAGAATCSDEAAGIVRFAPAYTRSSSTVAGDPSARDAMGVLSQWTGEHEATDEGPDATTLTPHRHPENVAIVTGAEIPGAGAYKPSTYALHCQIGPHQYTDTGAPTRRSEAFRNDAGFADIVEGDTVYLDFALYVPSTFPMDSGGATPHPWLVLQQCKGRNTGSPPIGVYLRTETRTLYLVGEHVGAPNLDLGELRLDAWTRITYGFHVQPDDRGWVSAWLDDRQVFCRTPRATIAAGDSLYPKQGLYESKDWSEVRHEVWHGPLWITTSEALARSRTAW